jgi:hypothetical protein
MRRAQPGRGLGAGAAGRPSPPPCHLRLSSPSPVAAGELSSCWCCSLSLRSAGLPR